MSSPISCMRQRLLARLAAPLAVLAALALAACGFQPLYVQQGISEPTVAAELQQIEVAVIAEREGQLLRTFLIERLTPGGRPADPTYRLTIQLRIETQSLSIQADDTATRANLDTVASYTLFIAGDPDAILTDQTNVTTSYNILSDQFATITAERDARERAMRQLAESIRRDLALFFAATAREEQVGSR